MWAALVKFGKILRVCESFEKDLWKIKRRLCNTLFFANQVFIFFKVHVAIKCFIVAGHPGMMTRVDLHKLQYFSQFKHVYGVPVGCTPNLLS